MATPAVQQFHNDNMRQERERVLLRIANGTKASNNLAIGNRMAHPSYKGLPDNSTGSKTMPFFAAKDESQCPIEDKIRMRGGVLHTKAGKEFGYKLLKRRAEDDINIRAAAEGLPPTITPLMELSEVERKSLELDELLNTLDEAVEMGDERVLSTAVNINQLPRLLIELAPTFAANQVKFVSAAGGDPADPASLLQFMFDMKEKIDNQYYYNGRNQESIRAEIEQDVLENADENTPDDIINQEVVRRMDELKRRAGPISRIYGLLSDSITFLQFLSQAISNSLIGKDLRTFIRIAAREAFKLNNKAINSALRVGENISPNNVALAGPFAGQLQVTANTPVAAPVRRIRPRVAEE